MAGQIVARGRGKWLVRVFLGRDPDTGTRRYHNRTIHGTKKDAERYLTATLREKDLGIFVEPARMSLNAYLDTWLETAAKPRLRPRTFEDYKWLFAKYVRPTLGDRSLDRIVPLDIQGLYTGMLQRGLTARTVRYVHTALSSALKQAVRWRMLSQNPGSTVELPRRVRREMQALSQDEVVLFQKAARADARGIIFTFLLASLMRPSEALALQWKDVNLAKGSVEVRRTLVRLRQSWHFAEPKTTRSRRTIPLPDTMTRDLREQRRLQAVRRLRLGSGYEDHDLVFATDDGRPLDLHNLTNRNFKSILKAAGLPQSVRIYDLRHTCATLLLAAGENAKVVSERLGHAGITLTLDTYAHVLPTMQKQAAERLETLLFGQ